MSITPFLRVPVTDLTGCLLNHQMVGRCADIEMKVVDCLEAYGRTRGKIKCADLLDDFKECTTRRKQFERIWLMRNERHMQYYKNERKEHYAEPPKVDSF